MAEVDIAAVQRGYAFTGSALDLGALVVDGAVRPDAPVRVPVGMLNRHGLVAGATGTGKTKTLQMMAEQLSGAGVPVFLADMKGDLSGLAAAGATSDRLAARTAEIGGPAWSPTAYPVEFLNLGGSAPHGVPVRTRVTSFGPILMAKVLGLNDTQESTLRLIFSWADQRGLDLDDLKDLRAVITFLTSDDGAAELEGIGGVSKQTAGVILRELSNFANAGADVFFGEPEFETTDLLRTDAAGRGVISVLELPGVAQQPELFSTFLMWLLADLFTELPEVGDLDQPKLVFFLDEAHLLFTGASKEFVTSITQTVRLIRSKGVGVFFVTQNPTDLDDGVLAQLGNRVQHALRAFTPADAKALRQTVSTFPRSGYDLEEVLTTLGIGEAVVTVLGENGAPTPVAWARLRAPQSRMGPADEATVAAVDAASPILPRYATATDDVSAAEMLAQRQQQAQAAALEQQTAADAAAADVPPPPQAPEPRQAPAPRRKAAAAASAGGVAAVLSSPTAQKMAKSVGQEIVRGIFGTSRRRKKRGWF